MIRFSLPVLGLCLFSLPALAQTTAPAPGACGPLVQLAQVDLIPAPNDGRMLVPVTVNGVAQKLVLGMAGGLITFNQATANALNLPMHNDSDKRVLDASGFASRRYVALKEFSVAGATVQNHTFAVTPDPKAGTDPVNDGVYDAGLQYRFDVEMDFASRKLTYFSPNHCPGHVVHWQAEVASTIPLSIVRRQEDTARHGSIASAAALINSADTLADSDYFLSLIDSNPGIAGSDVRIKVTLDGESFTANIDTALEYSTVNSDAARARLDVRATSPGSTPVESLVAQDPNHKDATPRGETVTVYGNRIFAHAFHTLSFGGVTVTNPKLMVRPDNTGAYDHDNGTLTGSRLYHLDDNVEPDISIGMDILSKLHLYFAFPERKLYVTPATAQMASK